MEIYSGQMPNGRCGKLREAGYRDTRQGQKNAQVANSEKRKKMKMVVVHRVSKVPAIGFFFTIGHPGKVLE